MDENQKSTMRWILFWVFLSIYIILTFLTIATLFFGLFTVAPEFKTPLFTTFIIEVGGAITALFYSLFGIGKSDKGNSVLNVESESIRNVDVVTDSPLQTEISLDKSVNLLGSFDTKINSLLTASDFTTKYSPCMLVFASKDTEYESFRPNVVIQIDQNPLPQLNMSLADYMESANSLTKEMQNIVGKRQVRSGESIATQWYRVKMTNILGVKIESDIIYTQFQKFVISNNLMGIITLTYADDTKPEDINILQSLLTEFGIKE